MKKRLILVAAVAVCASAMLGCSFSFGTGNNTVPAKPATANTAASNSNTSKAKTDDKAKPELKDEKKPEGSPKTAKKNPVPDSWIYYYDENKGYGFSLPEGSKGESETIDGIDVMAATTPSPSDVDVFVLAYKNKELTKEDLLDDAVNFLEGLGQKVTPGKLRSEGDDYAVADAASVHPTRGKGKLRILVGTDITDNYVMIIGTEEARFAANESIIDSIWGSFEMWSIGG